MVKDKNLQGNNILNEQRKIRYPVSTNKEFLRIITKLEEYAKTEYPILLIGETGTGKEVLSDYIHFNSLRKNKPFIKISLSSIPQNLIESELFGHVKGAYTDARDDKKGLFEIANNGTIFLDDIDDFPIELQSKLLRVLEYQEFFKIGAEKPTKVNLRIIASTKINLSELVNAGKFRSDLYFRLNVIPIEIPPLRKRKEDIPLLAEVFIKEADEFRKITLSDEAIKILQDYNWPGNVRELRNIIHRAVISCDGSITAKDLPEEIKTTGNKFEQMEKCKICFDEKNMSFDEIVACLEEKLIGEALQKFNYNQSKAAEYLRIKRTRLRDKMIKYNLL